MSTAASPVSAQSAPEVAAQRTRRAPRRRRRPARGRTLWLCAGVLLFAALAGASVAVSPLAPVAVLGAAALVVAAWHRPVVAAVVAAAVVPAVAGLDRGIGVPGTKLSELLLAVCAATLFLRRPARWRAFNGTDIALLLFALTAAAFGILHAADGNSSFESLLRVGLQPAFLFLAWWTAARGVAERADLLTVMRWVLVVSTVPAGLAILQYLDVPGVRGALIVLTGGDLLPVSGDDFSRVTGPFPIWHSLGGYLIVPTVLAVVLLLRDDREVLPLRWLLVTLAFSAVALIVSVTVTLLMWLPVAVLVAAFLARRTTRALAVIGGMVLVAVVLFPSILLDRLEAQATAASGTSEGVVPQTLAYRFLVWQRDYLPLLRQAIAFGLGNELPDSVFFSHTENQYLTYALRGGIALVTAACVAIGALFVRALRHARAASGAPQSAAIAVVGVVSFLPAAAMVWPYLTNAGLPAVLFAFAGAALAGRSPGASRPYAKVPSPAVPGAAAVSPGRTSA